MYERDSDKQVKEKNSRVMKRDMTTADSAKPSHNRYVPNGKFHVQVGSKGTKNRAVCSIGLCVE